MIDARVNVSIISHPKTKKLIRRLGDGGAWKLVCLFLWAAANRSDGKLTGMTAEDVELAVDWAGDDGAFVATLVAVGFLDGEDGSYAIHDWAEHNPWSAGAGARSEKAKWIALCKHHGRERAAEQMPAYAARLLQSASSTPAADDSMQDAENSSAPSPLPSPSPSPSPSAPPSTAAVASAEPTSGQSRKTTFRAWLTDIRASGQKAVSDYQPVWDYAEQVGIPAEWIELAWICFRERYSTDEKASLKRYADWRRVFLRAVKEGWMGVWSWSDRDQSYRLTTTGIQTEKAVTAQEAAQ
jgi:hypothetical protein